MIRYLTLVLMLLPSGLSGQCIHDTIPPGPPFPPYRDTTTAGDPLPCYDACLPCSTSTSVTVPPMDGCLMIIGDEGWVTAIVRDTCNLILKDTCFYVIPAAAVFGQLCYSYPEYTIVTMCRDTPAAVTIQYDPGMGSGWPMLDTLVDYDTLPPCPPAMLDEPLSEDYYVGSIGPIGQPYNPKVDRIEIRLYWDGKRGLSRTIQKIE